jgi:hypothetical protein
MNIYIEVNMNENQLLNIVNSEIKQIQQKEKKIKINTFILNGITLILMIIIFLIIRNIIKIKEFDMAFICILIMGLISISIQIGMDIRKIGMYYYLDCEYTWKELEKEKKEYLKHNEDTILCENHDRIINEYKEFMKC